MRCDNCKHDNDASKQFCTQCGSRLGGRKCPQGHSIPEGLPDCPYCPKPIERVATVVEPRPMGGGPVGRQKTQVVPPDELQRSGVQVGLQGARPAERKPESAGRERTVFRAPDAVEPAPGTSRGVTLSPTESPRAPSGGQPPLVGFLVSFDMDTAGSFWPLRYGRTVLGSAPECDVPLQGKDISGRHAHVMVRRDAGTTKVWITDNDSTNGTRVNGEEIFDEKRKLGHGDRISISGMSLLVLMLPAESMP